MIAGRRGIVLVASLLLLTLLMAGGLGALLSMQTDLRSSGNLKTGREAFYIAEAGLNRAWQEMNDADGNLDFAVVAAAAGKLVLFANEPFAGGSYTVTAEKLPVSGPLVRVTSVGCVPAAYPCTAGYSKAALEARFRRASLFPCLVCAVESAALSTGVTTDSYNSALGAYRPEGAGRAGHVLSYGSVDLAGPSTVINGDVTAVGRVAVGEGVTVNGRVLEHARFREMPPAQSCGPPFHDGSGIKGGSYNPATGELRGSGADAIVLSAGTYCFRSVALENSSSLSIAGPVRIHLTEASSFAAGGIVNPTARAENLMIFSSFSSADSGIEIAGGSSVYMTVYAPRAKITFSGPGDFFGAAVGRTVANRAAVRLHYDQKLADNEDGGVTLVSWKEVF